MATSSCSPLRKTKWFKLDDRSKLMTLRQTLRNVPKLTDTMGAASPPSASSHSVFQPYVSHFVMNQVSLSAAVWASSLEATFDIYARNQKPIAGSSQREGYQTVMTVFPTRHVERLYNSCNRCEMYVSGSDVSQFDIGVLRSSEGRRRDKWKKKKSSQEEMDKTVSSDDSSDNPAAKLEAAEVQVYFEDMPGPYFTDFDVRDPLLHTIAAVHSSLYVHGLVCCVITRNPIIHQLVHCLWPHLVEEGYVCVREPLLEETLRDELREEPIYDKKTGDKIGVEMVRTGRKVPRVPFFCRDTLKNTFVVIPPLEYSSTMQWSQKDTQLVARYLFETNAKDILVDENWCFYLMLRDEYEKSMRFANECNVIVNDINRRDRQSGYLQSGGYTPVNWNNVQSLHTKYVEHLRSSYCCSFFLPKYSEARFIYRQAIKRDVQSHVVGVNTSATDVIGFYPQACFSRAIGNSMRYRGVDKTILTKSLGVGCGHLDGIGGGIENHLVYHRERVGTAAQDKAAAQWNSKEPRNALQHERIVDFLVRPHISTAVPMLSAKYFGF